MTVINMPTHVFDLADPKTFILDLANQKPKEVLAIVETFEDHMKKNALPEVLPVTTGWNEIDPPKAVNLLQRNRLHANRRVDPATVFYYARQMAKGDWKATGQPILVDKNGWLADAQHRLLANLISGTSITTYVITDIEPGLFAYIDNSKPRTAASALQTIGINGVASTIIKVIKLAEELRLGCYNPAGSPKPLRQPPAEMLEIAKRYPNAQQTSRAARTDWTAMVDYLGGASQRHLVAWFAMQVADLNDGETLPAEDFFDDVISEDAAREPDHPIAAFRKKMAAEANNPVLKPHHIIAAMIKTFNAWQKGERLKGRWMLQVDENMPTIELPTTEQEAA